MRIDTAGTARIRHKDTGEIFDVEADELEWEAVGGSERQMGPETEYAAEVHHPDLGELVWKLWEYPVGAENYQDQELNGHELVVNFDIDLVHEPDGPDEPDDEDDLAPSENVPSDELKEWFYGAYEDPAQSLPYNSREGGYQWIRGGPYTALEALEEEYGNQYAFEDLEKIAREIEDESGGLTEWSPIDDVDDFDRVENEPKAPTPEERRIAAEQVRRSAAELEELLAPLIDIRRNHVEVDEDDRPGIGHNGPPDPLDEIGLTADLFEEARAATATIEGAVARTQEIVEEAGRTGPPPVLLPQPDDPAHTLGRALAEYGAALKENTSAVLENTAILKEKAKLLGPKNLTIGVIGAAIGGKLLEGALTKLGEMLLEKGLPLVAPLGPAAAGYLEQVAVKLNQFADLAMQYINMLPPLM